MPLSIGFEHFVGKQINKQNYVQVHLEQSLGDIEFEIPCIINSDIFSFSLVIEKKKVCPPPPFLNQRSYTVIISYFTLIYILPDASYLSKLKNYELTQFNQGLNWKLIEFLKLFSVIFKNHQFFYSSLQNN